MRERAARIDYDCLFRRRQPAVGGSSSKGPGREPQSSPRAVGRAMSLVDWIVLCVTLGLVVLYGLWRSRGSNGVDHYLLAGRTMPWYAMALSIMATQASAVTFISTTGQSYVDGMRFVQFYFGLPLAMVILSFTAVPIFHRAKVYTAYEYLEQRFDAKTRHAGQRRLPDPARAGARHHAVRAGRGPDRDPRLAGLADDAHHGRHRRRLHDGGRRQGDGVVAHAADAGHDGRPGGGLVCAVLLLPSHVSFGDAVTLAGAAGRLNAVTTELRLERPLQPLERPDRRHVPGPRLFRHRPVAGAALPHRQVDRAEPAQPAVQRRRQDPDAVLHSLFIGAMVFVFYIFEQPPMLFQQTELQRVQHPPPAGRTNA